MVDPDQVAAVQGLRGAQHTLTVSLDARAVSSRQPAPIIDDPVAERLAQVLGLRTDFSGIVGAGTVVGTAVRTQFLDERTRRFAVQHPNAVAITIGAGLCTRCDRLAGVALRWVDLDVPQVVAIREALLPAGGDRQVHAMSADDAEGVRALVASQDGPVLVIMEGLSMYLSEAVMRQLMGALVAAAAPGSQILLEAVGTSAVRHSRRNRSIQASAATFRWGVDDLVDVAGWSPRLRLVDAFFFVDAHRDRWPFLFRVLRPLPAFRRQAKIGVYEVASLAEPSRPHVTGP